MKSPTSIKPAFAIVVLLATLAATNPAFAQALEPVVRGATIARDTIVGITLLLMTVAVGIAGYKIAFSGATFRDVTGLMLGGAICGGAAAIAAIFLG